MDADRRLSEIGDPNDTEELDPVMVMALMVVLFFFLVVMLYVAHYLAKRFCPNDPGADHPIPGLDARDAPPPAAPLLPFSSKIRRNYLETRLKFEVFCADGGSGDVETGTSTNHVTQQWKCVKSLDKCSSVATDSDSNNESSSSDDEEEEEEHAVNDNDDEHDVNNDERSVKELDDTNDCWLEDGLNTATQCLICFESYGNGDELVRHCSRKKSFHRSCIIEWLLRNDNCPYCRSPILSLSTPTDMDEQ